MSCFLIFFCLGISLFPSKTSLISAEPSFLCEPEFHCIVNINSDNHSHQADKEFIDILFVDLLVHLTADYTSCDSADYHHQEIGDLNLRHCSG